MMHHALSEAVLDELGLIIHPALPYFRLSPGYRTVVIATHIGLGEHVNVLYFTAAGLTSISTRRDNLYLSYGNPDVTIKRIVELVLGDIELWYRYKVS